MSGGFYNILDATVVAGCLFLFVAMILSSSGYAKILEEVSEEILLIAWSAFQSMRIFLIVKKQNLA
jgi:hypothetical protein